MKTKLQIIHTVKSFDPIASELAASIENHDLDKFKAIIDSNPEVLRMGNIYARDESSRDVFPYIIAMGSYEHLLAIYGFGEGISYIINNNKYANWNCLDGGIRHTPLMYAAMTGNTETAQKLIALGVNVNQFDSCGYTPLMHAALKGHTATVEKLIALGADVDNANNEGSTPLIWAAREGHTDTVEKLIELGADVNKANKRHGYTPLMIAAREGHIESVKKLIAHGADVNKADRYSKTPLMFAAWNHRIEIVKILIAHGADKVTDKKHIKQPILKILKAQEYIDDLLEGKQTRTLNFDATIEEMLLARVENKLSKLLGSGKFIDNINRIQTTFEGHRKTHPIADKVLTKVDDFIDNVLDKDAEGARSLGLSFPQPLKDIMEFASFQGDNTHELSEKLLRAYDNHKNEPSVIERLNEHKASFESYLDYKKSYLAEHPEHNLSEIPNEILPKLNLLFSNLLQLEGMNEYQSVFDEAPLLEESILFYSLNPNYQLPGSLTDIGQ